MGVTVAPWCRWYCPPKQTSDVGARMASPNILTVEKARNRWNAMAAAADWRDGGVLRVPTTAVTGDVSKHSDYNKSWHLAAVSMMVRAGALAWDFGTADVDGRNDEIDEGRDWLSVRLLRADHQTDDYWNDDVETFRQERMSVGRDGWARLVAALSGDHCTGELVARNYTIEAPQEMGHDVPVELWQVSLLPTDGAPQRAGRVTHGCGDPHPLCQFEVEGSGIGWPVRPTFDRVR